MSVYWRNSDSIPAGFCKPGQISVHFGVHILMGGQKRSSPTPLGACAICRICFTLGEIRRVLPPQLQFLREVLQFVPRRQDGDSQVLQF